MSSARTSCRTSHVPEGRSLRRSLCLCSIQVGQLLLSMAQYSLTAQNTERVAYNNNKAICLIYCSRFSVWGKLLVQSAWSGVRPGCYLPKRHWTRQNPWVQACYCIYDRHFLLSTDQYGLTEQNSGLARYIEQHSFKHFLTANQFKSISILFQAMADHRIQNIMCILCI